MVGWVVIEPLDAGFHATFVRPRNRAQGTKRSCMYTHACTNMFIHVHICVLTMQYLKTFM